MTHSSISATQPSANSWNEMNVQNTCWYICFDTPSYQKQCVHVIWSTIKRGCLSCSWHTASVINPAFARGTVKIPHVLRKLESEKWGGSWCLFSPLRILCWQLHSVFFSLFFFFLGWLWAAPGVTGSRSNGGRLTDAYFQPWMLHIKKIDGMDSGWAGTNCWAVNHPNECAASRLDWSVTWLSLKPFQVTNCIPPWLLTEIWGWYIGLQKAGGVLRPLRCVVKLQAGVTPHNNERSMISEKPFKCKGWLLHGLHVCVCVCVCVQMSFPQHHGGFVLMFETLCDN